MGRKFRGVLPAGTDEVVAAEEVRQGMWMLDPVTGEWANVAGFERPRRLVCFGGVASTPLVVISLRRFGAREMAPGDRVSIRVPAQVPPEEQYLAAGADIAQASTDDSEERM